MTLTVLRNRQIFPHRFGVSSVFAQIYIYQIFLSSPACLKPKFKTQIKKPRATDLVATELVPVGLAAGGFCEIRTRDLRIKSPLLYQLS